MTKAFGGIAVALACSSLGGCATQYYAVQPVTLAEQRQQDIDGHPTIWQSKGQGTMAVTPHAADGKHVWFEVVVANRGNSRVLFNTDKMQFSDGANKNVRVYSAGELEDQLERESDRQSFAARFDGVVREINADNSTATRTTTTYQGTVTLSTRGGEMPKTAEVSGTSTSVTYDPEKAEAERQAARKDTDARLAAIETQRDQGERIIQDEVLKPTFVQPGQSYGGRVEIDMPQGGRDLRKVSMVAEWAGQSYRFDFNLTPIK